MIDVGRSLVYRFSGTKSVKATRLEDDGCSLQWVNESGCSRTTTEVILSEDAIRATAEILAAYVRMLDESGEGECDD